MGKGKLGPNGWEVGSRARATRGSVEEVNAANNKLVKENSQLRDALEEQGDNVALQEENARLQSENEKLKVVVISSTLNLLDSADDTHWTQEGLPRVEVICELMGDDTVTREQIEMARPEFTRETAAASNDEK